MKQFIIIIFLGVFASAGDIWSLVKNASSDGKIQTKQYEIEVAGTNVRGYIFTVPEMRSVCINIYTERTQTLECKTFAEMKGN